MKVTPIVTVIHGDGETPPSLREVHKDRAAHNALTRSRVVVAFNGRCTEHRILKDNVNAFSDGTTIKRVLGL